jgi:hypothetical protein
MNKVLSGIKKYTPYVMLLLGIWIIVTFFIAGGIKTNPKAINPNTGEVYYFTVFQVMFGKGFKVGNATLTYFKMNLFGFITLIPFLVGLIIATFNKIQYRIRHLIAGFLLLISGLSLFMLPSSANLGDAWLNPDSVVVKGGAVIIVAGTLILVFSAINFVLLFLKDKK